MTMILEFLSGLCLLLGGMLCITGGVGLLRMPDFFSRVHASGVTETLAATFILTGLLLQMEWSLASVKIIMILLLVLSINPIATHAMAKATLHGGQRPLVFDDDRIAGGKDSEGEDSSKP